MLSHRSETGTASPAGTGAGSSQRHPESWPRGAVPDTHCLSAASAPPHRRCHG